MKSSSSNILARENLSAYQRWEMASLQPTASATDAAPDDARQREDEIARARAQAVAEGRAEGYAAGLAQASTERARLAAVLQSLEAAAGDHVDRLMDEVLDLALVLGRQLVGEALAVRRSLVLPVVAAALQQLPQSVQRVQVVANPGDVEIIRQFLDGDLSRERRQVIGDSLIAPGGCRIETEQCEVDATLPTRWRRLLAGLGRTDDWLEPE